MQKEFIQITIPLKEKEVVSLFEMVEEKTGKVLRKVISGTVNDDSINNKIKGFLDGCAWHNIDFIFSEFQGVEVLKAIRALGFEDINIIELSDDIYLKIWKELVYLKKFIFFFHREYLVITQIDEDGYLSIIDTLEESSLNFASFFIGFKSCLSSCNLQAEFVKIKYSDITEILMNKPDGFEIQSLKKSSPLRYYDILYHDWLELQKQKDVNQEREDIE